MCSSDAPVAAKHRRERAPISLLPRVGLIDSGVDGSHPVFREALIHPWGCGGRVLPSAHGTAVASLLVGQSTRFHGVLDKAELYAADVYCNAPTGGAVDALAAAFAWLAQQRVAVINVSLVGPDNAALAQIVRALTSRGYLLVAAVGNDGPAAPPLYPASYPHVVGVTAVDAHRRVLIEAARGNQVMFAARGADMSAADIGGKYSADSRHLVCGAHRGGAAGAIRNGTRLEQQQCGNRIACAKRHRLRAPGPRFDIWLWARGGRLPRRYRPAGPLKPRFGKNLNNAGRNTQGALVSMGEGRAMGCGQGDRR